MTRRHSFFKSNYYENPQDNFDYEDYIEMSERGYKERHIANELNVSQNFLTSIKKQEEEDF